MKKEIDRIVYDNHPEPDKSPILSMDADKGQEKSRVLRLLFILFLFIFFAGLAGSLYVLKKSELLIPNLQKQNLSQNRSPFLAQKSEIKKFVSKEEFIDYLQNGTAYQSYAISSLRAIDSLSIPTTEGFSAQGLAAPNAIGAAPDTAMKMLTPDTERYSETNVQVKGIDEPDIVKTDGTDIYFSSQIGRYYPAKRMVSSEPLMDIFPSPLPPVYQQGEVKVISALPAEKINQRAGIAQTGNLLISGDVLVILGEDNNLYGYNRKEASPSAQWHMKLDDRSRIAAARKLNNKLYLITSTSVGEYEPCPIRPLADDKQNIVIECTDIYHPTVYTPVDTTYTVLIINPDNGNVEKKTAFVGSSSQSVVYMSPQALYVSYSYSGSMVDLMYAFFTEDGKDLVPQTVIDKLGKLKEYDISPQAKMIELETILNSYQRSLSNDERLKAEQELENRAQAFLQKHLREMEKTGIAKVNIDSLNIEATGDIPGRILNQFSLDEYNNTLRVATTVSGNFLGSRGTQNNVNDVYTLGNKLEIIGSVKDLGKGERIYSARFIGDKGYIVTFRQTDPFYILDLADPRNPQLKGELKIPGYSSYLHPLTSNTILGVGMEGSQVKLSLFDVSKPEEPKELDKYILSEYWSEVNNNHHAFLQDERNKFFFIPGGKGGYVFSYDENSLKLRKAISGPVVKRALYINDNLYVVSEEKLTVLKENTWEPVSELVFQDSSNNPVIQPFRE